MSINRRMDKEDMIYRDRQVISEFCENNNIDQKHFARFMKKSRYNTEQCFQYFKGEIPAPSGKYYMRLASKNEMIVRRQLCDEIDISEFSFENFKRKSNYSESDCIAYFHGQIAGPDGKYYKHRLSAKEVDIRKQFCKENDVNIHTFDSIKRKYQKAEENIIKIQENRIKFKAFLNDNQESLFYS